MERVSGRTAKLKVLTAMARRDKMTYSELGRRVGVTPHCIWQRLHKKSLLVDEVVSMADAMGYDVELNLIERETGVKI